MPYLSHVQRLSIGGNSVSGYLFSYIETRNEVKVITGYQSDSTARCIFRHMYTIKKKYIKYFIDELIAHGKIISKFNCNVFHLIEMYN